MISGIARILSCLLLFSCNDEDFSPANHTGMAGDNICFGIAHAETNRTRAIANKDSRVIDHFVLRGEGIADTLCVRASVSDGIASSALESRHPMTRAAQITSLEPYGKFHLLAYWTMSGQVLPQFYMDETVNQTTALTGDGQKIWSTDQPYYWFTDGEKHKLQFYAYAPVDAGIIAPTTGTGSRVLAYEVPPEVAAQQDVVLASTENLAGNYCDYVPLNFKHICTAVRFVTGSEMQPGKITDITLSGIPYKGTYDMTASYDVVVNDVTDSWNIVAGETRHFAQTLNKVTDGSEDAGTEITPAEGTFIMLPQVLPEGATVTVTFEDATTGTRELTASLTGHKWPMGKTVTYKISISSEYELEFTSTPQVQDAHYVMYPITVKAADMKGKSWTVSVDGNPDWITLKWEEDLIDLERQGFWIDNGDANYTARTASIDRNEDGEFTVYAFLAENITADRKAVLSAKVDGQTVAQFEIDQKAALPATNGGYVELFDDRVPEDTKPVPWGFSWTKDDNIEFVYSGSGDSSGKIPEGHRQALIDALKEMGIQTGTTADNPVCIVPGKNEKSLTVTINLASFKLNEIALNENDGQKNTWEIYSLEGVADLNRILQFLIDFPDLALKAGSLDAIKMPDEFAAFSALKKNKFNLSQDIVTGPNGEQIVTFKPVIQKADVKWYLPARNEFGFIPTNNDYPLSGTYWTSTALQDDNTMTQAYAYSASSTLAEDRGAEHKIRAMRVGN